MLRSDEGCVSNGFQGVFDVYGLETKQTLKRPRGGQRCSGRLLRQRPFLRVRTTRHSYLQHLNKPQASCHVHPLLLGISVVAVFFGLGHLTPQKSVEGMADGGEVV